MPRLGYPTLNKLYARARRGQMFAEAPRDCSDKQLASVIILSKLRKGGDEKGCGMCIYRELIGFDKQKWKGFMFGDVFILVKRKAVKCPLLKE